MESLGSAITVIALEDALGVALALAVLGVALKVGCMLVKPASQDFDFWGMYAKFLALIAVPFLGWIVYKASAVSGQWWQSAPAVALVTAIVGAIAPATTFIVSWAKIRLDDKRQQHEITSDYLNRALNAELPLATRHQLLRFLSTAPRQGDRLHGWAREELKRIGPAYERQERDAEQIQKEIANAKSPKDLELAERKLQAVIGRTERSMADPPKPKLTLAALKSGVFRFEDVGGLALPNADLSGAEILGLKMADSDFTGAKFVKARLTLSDCRRSKFDGADMLRADFHGTDLRGASFVNANLTMSDLSQSHLQACDFSSAILDGAEMTAAGYDDLTIWPSDFDPAAAGAVHDAADAIQATPAQSDDG